MRIPSYADTFQVLLLQAADEGRGALLFGESLRRARETVPPFLVGDSFPTIYLEHPLIGEPFLDITVLFGQLEPGARIDSPAAGEHAAMLDWYAETRLEHDHISCGFELDTKESALPIAGVHFQPRSSTELVKPFCEAVGEPERAGLYLDLVKRMPDNWSLSFFGMFRGRAGSPLRVCGYLDKAEGQRCAESTDHLASVFDEIGFSAYDDTMLSQISALMATNTEGLDFQFDVYPDGHIGDVFAIDLQFGIEQPELVFKNFENGVGSHVMGLLENWGVADERWKQSIRSAFARALPVELEGGGMGRFAFTLMPQWVKARWKHGVLQPAKLYHLAHSGLIEKSSAS